MPVIRNYNTADEVRQYRVHWIFRSLQDGPIEVSSYSMENVSEQKERAWK